MEQELVKICDTAKLAERFKKEIDEFCLSRHKDAIELSVYQGEPATHAEIEMSMVALKSIWPMNNTFYGMLEGLILKSGMSRKRLQDAVENLVMTHSYGKSFTPAQLLSYDKKILVAKTPSSLRAKCNEPLSWDDIVVIEFNHERAITTKQTADDNRLHIVGLYKEPGVVDWIDTFKSPQYEARRKTFGDAIRRYVDDGTYPREMCLDFYYYWSQPVMCGDTMLKEIRWNEKRCDEYGNKIDTLAEHLEEWKNTIWKQKQEKINSDESKS